MNEVKKVILFLLCCAIPFSFYAQKARQNAVTKKWGYEQTENKGWWENSKYRGNSMFGCSNNIQDGFVFNVFLWNVDTQEHSFGIRIITCIYELHYEQYEEVHKQEYDK